MEILTEDRLLTMAYDYAYGKTAAWENNLLLVDKQRLSNALYLLTERVVGELQTQQQQWVEEETRLAAIPHSKRLQHAAWKMHNQRFIRLNSTKQKLQAALDSVNRMILAARDDNELYPLLKSAIERHKAIKDGFGDATDEALWATLNGRWDFE